MAAGVPAVRGAEQQPLVLCPSARLCPGFVIEAFGGSGRRYRIKIRGGGSVSPGKQREEGLLIREIRGEGTWGTEALRVCAEKQKAQEEARSGWVRM